MLASIQDSMLVLYTRYTSIRSFGTKAVLWGSIIFVMGLVLLSSFAGEMIKIAASITTPDGETARMFAATYLRSFQSGELGTLVATTLGLTLVSVMIAPFTGVSSTSLIPTHSLVSIRASDRHRFFDSFILQMCSSISILQLFTLTAVASLLTLEGGRIEGVLIAWASWPILLALSTFFVWVAEMLYRQFGEKRRLMILGTALAIIALAVYLNPAEAKTVFGIGTGYAWLIQNVYTFDLGIQILSFALLGLSFMIFFYAAYKMAFYTLARPEIHIKDNAKTETVRPWKPSKIVVLELFHSQMVQLWRNVEVRKSLIIATLFGAAVLFFGSNMENLSSTLIFIIPLLVSLSWGANTFGIMGTGALWFFSKPKFAKNIIWVTYTLQVSVSLVLFSIMVLPAAIAGKLDYETLIGMFLAIIATSFAMCRSALSKSVHHPYPYKGGVRGENILPPGIILGYTFRMSLWSGMLGFIIMSSENVESQIGLAAAAVVWSCIRVAILTRSFIRKDSIRNKIIFTVGADQ